MMSSSNGTLLEEGKSGGSDEQTSQLAAGPEKIADVELSLTIQHNILETRPGLCVCVSLQRSRDDVFFGHSY